MPAESARTQSIEPQQRSGDLLMVDWEAVSQPGAYVEMDTGSLIRIPREALIQGASPIVRRENAHGSRLVRISANPFVTTLEARLLAAQNNLSVNF